MRLIADSLVVRATAGKATELNAVAAGSASHDSEAATAYTPNWDDATAGIIDRASWSSLKLICWGMVDSQTRTP